MPHILLMTDFGTRDGYAAILKGVIWTRAPMAQVDDLTHEIAAQDVLGGALTLGRAAPYFPPGSIFVGVVDPGVGTQRRGLACRCGEQFFVGPDNGLFTWVMRHARRAGLAVECVQLDQPVFWLPQPSFTFHGRDVFAPVAAALANGTPLAALGSPLDDPVYLDLPEPQRVPGGWLGQVLHVDAFGNLATNLGSPHLPATGPVTVRLAGVEITELIHAYGERPAGTLVALLDSAGALSVAVVNGHAAARLGCGVGTAVELGGAI